VTFKELQAEQADWSNYNFGCGAPAWHCILGALEELGELAHAYLKGEQGIRKNAKALCAAERDAVGDTIIYLTDFCNRRGYDLETIIRETWGEVRSRDWRAYPKTGRP
jgi:NTP pyrophosphatase (non-canonical NTP hydrolase)